MHNLASGEHAAQNTARKPMRITRSGLVQTATEQRRPLRREDAGRRGRARCGVGVCVGVGVGRERSGGCGGAMEGGLAGLEAEAELEHCV
eukprot:3247292-Rhodomonas_salina.1